MNTLNLSSLLKFNFSDSSLEDLQNILSAWEIRKFSSKRVLKGSINQPKWIIITKNKKYILRNFGSDLEWMNWIISVSNKLSQSSFCYSFSQALPGKGEKYYSFYKGDYWILYEYIEGQLLGAKPNTTQTYEAGVLVAKFHRAVCDLQSENMALYELKLFEAEEFNRCFQKTNTYNLGVWNHSKNQSAQVAALFENAYSSISSYKSIINGMQKIPVHYDLHGGNILKLGNRIIGLIDFDALAVAPRIIDVQNALLHMSRTRREISLSQSKAFIEGYVSIWSLSPDELDAIYPLMIERLFASIAQVIKTKCTESTRLENLLKDAIGFQNNSVQQLIHILDWLIRNKALFIEQLHKYT